MSRDNDDISDFENNSRSCNSTSACALRNIINMLDDLNTRDLRTLDQLIDRLLCCRS